MNTETIEYDPAKLREQCPIIQQSKWNALKNIGDNAYFRAIGLSASDPPELWRFALSRSEPLSGAEHYKQFRANLGKPTLRETVLNLATRIEDDAVLQKHSVTLLKISEREPLTEADYKLSRADSDETKRVLIAHWIQDPPTELLRLLVGSLCFYSDRAMANMVFWLANKRKKFLPRERLTIEAERIRKVYGSLGLIPARPRAFKDFTFYAGTFHLEPFKKLVKK